MSLKDRLKLNENNSIGNSQNKKTLKTDDKKVKEQKFLEILFESYIEKDCNILVCCPIEVTTSNALNFLCSKIPQEKRLVGIGTNLLLNPDELIKFEPDTKNLSKDLIKTSLSLNPYKLILQDFQGAEAIDIFKLINSGLKNIITAVCAKDAQKAIQQAKLNLYLSGLNIPDALTEQMLNEFFDIIVTVAPDEKSKETFVITDLTETKNKEIKKTKEIVKKTENKTTPEKSKKTEKPKITQTTADMAPNNILASKLKQKNINE